MYSFELFEAPKNIVVLYAGRFQPFHKGHRAVYEYLVKKFGRDAVYVSTSNKTDADKSPFTFSDKAYFMQIQGIPMDRVRETNQPYQNPELVKTFDPENTALIVAVSDKDKDRFGKIGYKKDGSLSFFQDMPNELGDMAALSQHGYVMTVPTFDFTVYGRPMRSATEVRAMYRAANEQVRREIIKDLFGKYTPEAEQIMNAKLKEDIMPASTDTISPVHESWTKKYKKSIDCSNPKGFSQKAHCAGRKARQGGRKTKSQSVSENLEGHMIDLTKNFPTYTSLIGRITKENPTKVTIEIIQADGPGNVKVGDELRIATNYIKRLPITESHHTDIPGMLEKFLPIAMKELGIAKLPSIKLTKHLKPHGTQASFGMYNPDDGKIYLAIADRHPVDILRTLAHELVHFSQDGKHELDAGSGETGSREENEANSVAGVIMRRFNNEFPDAIKSDPLVTENKKKDKSVGELEQTLRNPHSYKAIDHAMQSIARKYKISASELHDKFVKHHGTIPDNWAKKLEEFVTANYGIGKTPGVLARVGPKGQVPRAKLHVNVPKKTAVKLGIPHTHLKEAFDAPYPMDWEHGDDDESYDALVTLPDGTNMSIMFSKEYGDYGEEEWQVEFYRNNSQDVTGEGDAQRIFATVLSAIQQFIKLEKPKRIKFSAAKQTGDMTPNTSRTSLYNRLVQRFADNLGYGVKTTDYSLNTVYELERLREGVAEGMDSLDPFTRSVLNRMEDDSWLSAEHAYFITKGIQKKKQTNPEAYNQEIQRFVDLYKQYKGQQGVVEGVVDEPQNQLSDIFTPDGKLQPVIRSTIIKAINAIQKKFPKNRILDFYMVGAPVTYQYSPNSDMDVSLVYASDSDPQKTEEIWLYSRQLEKTIPPWSGVSATGTKTLRPYQFTPQIGSGRNSLSNADGAYDIVKDQWIKKPNLQQTINDYQKLIKNSESKIRQKYAAAERTLQSAFSRLLVALNRNGLDTTSKNIIVKISKFQQTIKSWRNTGYKQDPGDKLSNNWSTGNIIFKMLDKEGYHEVFQLLSTAIKNNFKVDDAFVSNLISKLEAAIGDESGYVIEDAKKNLSVQQLAAISDAALDKAYGYGRSTPGNSFGWQANLKSAAYAKQMIDKGVTDIEAISDAIHKGWNVTAQAFVQNPDQFDDTEKLRQAGKLEAKLQQRAKLMKINYAQLPDEEKEKDRVVARALLQAIKGQQDVAENFADGKVKGKSRPGRVKAAGASCKGSVTNLRARAKKYSGERGKMYHWCANMKAGKKK